MNRLSGGEAEQRVIDSKGDQASAWPGGRLKHLVSGCGLHTLTLRLHFAVSGSRGRVP